MAVAATGLLLAGCETIVWLPIAAFIWVGILLMVPLFVVALPVLPFYYALEGVPGNTGTQTVAFAPDGEDLVVAYKQRRKMHLYRVPLDGSACEQLTEGDRFDFDPVFAPDGRSIVFASRVDKAQANLFSMALETKETSPLTTGEYEDWAPQFSPDGGLVAFTRREKDSMAHVYLVDAGGGEARAITAGEEAYDVGPVFLPDGETILFARLTEAPKWDPDYDASWERRSLYTISRDGQGIARVARRYDGKEHWARRATAEQPVVTSYAGNLLLCDPEAVSALRASGVPEAPVGDWVEELGAYTKCTFSRDGQRVAFATCRRSGDDGCEYSLRVAATGAKQSQAIVKKPCEIRDVTFSPDGARLVFVARTRVSAERDHYELWTVRFDGTELRRLPVSEEERKNMEKHERREQRKRTPRSQNAAVLSRNHDREASNSLHAGAG